MFFLSCLIEIDKLVLFIVSYSTGIIRIRAVDPHSLFADLDPGVLLNAGPDPGGKINADP